MTTFAGNNSNNLDCRQTKHWTICLHQEAFAVEKALPV